MSPRAVKGLRHSSAMARLELYKTNTLHSARLGRIQDWAESSEVVKPRRLIGRRPSQIKPEKHSDHT